jgi:hypothetical protein
MTKNICDSVNHTHFPKEDHLPEWARRDNEVKKADRVEDIVSETVGLSADSVRKDTLVHTKQFHMAAGCLCVLTPTMT